MPPSSSQSQPPHNVWFGVSMFLIGLIVGSIFTFFSGVKLPFASQPTQVTAPTDAQPAPKLGVEERMKMIAKDLDLDASSFASCLTSGKFADLINAHQASGTKAGVNGTPGTVIVHQKTGQARLVPGAYPFEAFKAEIDAMLVDPTSAPKNPSIQVLSGSVVDGVNFDFDHWRGSRDADIVLIEYSDYQCPYCHAVHPTLKQVITEYGSKIAWVYRHFPLSFHPEAVPLATGAECANELGGLEAFWKFTDMAMNNGK